MWRFDRVTFDDVIFRCNNESLKWCFGKMMWPLSERRTTNRVCIDDRLTDRPTERMYRCRPCLGCDWPIDECLHAFFRRTRGFSSLPIVFDALHAHRASLRETKHTAHPFACTQANSVKEPYATVCANRRVAPDPCNNKKSNVTRYTFFFAFSFSFLRLNITRVKRETIQPL